MAEVPEHLLRRSKERRKALGLPVDGDDEGTDAGEGPADAAQAAGAEGASDAEQAPAAGVTPDAASEAITADVETEGGAKIPAHLLERSRRRKEGAAAAAGGGGGGTATAVAAPPAPGTTGPGGHTQRLLTVVKSGSIQQTRAEAADKVHTWPHLVVIEFASILIVTAGVTIFSALVRAPLLGLADFNRTPNPSKAPWYFLGLQELLTMFHPMVAGVTVPGLALILLILAPYIDKNPSNKPEKRKFAISIMTVHLMFWMVLVMIGSFFRGPGFNFVFPWEAGLFFEL
jgi:hypothetical protein